MLSDDGTVDFAGELLGLVGELFEQYERRCGQVADELERGLILSYLLGLMRCDLEAIWDALGHSEVFGPVHPKQVFEDCSEHDGALEARQRQEIEQELVRRGWIRLPSQQSGRKPSNRRTVLPASTWR